MPEPTSSAEYLARFRANTTNSGFGLDTVMSMPCPFCAAPNFMTPKVVDTETALATGATCSQCGRSAKALIQRDPSVIEFEIVQTGGPDQPDWLTPKMRRVSE